MTENDKVLDALRAWRLRMLQVKMIDTSEVHDLSMRHHRLVQPRTRSKYPTKVFRKVKDD